MNPAMLESDVEEYLLDRCRQLSYKCMKFTSPARSGVPDRVVITPALTAFVELKRPSGSLRRLQKVVQQRMRDKGAVVLNARTVAEVETVLEQLGELNLAHPAINDQVWHS